MTNIIPFPEPYEQKLILAQKAMEKENYLEAKLILEKLYEQTTTFEVSQLLVKVYIFEGEEVKALRLADELEDDYLSSMEGIKQYFQLIVLNHQFIRAHILLNSGKKHKFLAEEQGMLNLFEKVYESTNIAVFQEKKRQFQSFKMSKSPVSQLVWKNWLVGLTKKQFESLVIPSLIEFNSPFLTSRSCEVLVKIGERGIVQVRHPLVDEIKDISLENIKLLEKSECLNQLTKLLREYYGDNPFLFEVLYAEIVGHWAFLFPFLPASADVKEWLTVYSRDYERIDDSNITHDSDIQKIVEIQKQEIRQNIQFFE